VIFLKDWGGGVILGTGVGGGVVIGKELIAGHNKIAGEWGHNPLPWATESERPGAPCYCGKSDCVETFLSGAGVPSGMWLEFGGAISGNMKVSFQAARSIG
jgi:fructokinase